jgi:hypothetical protein
MVVGRERESTKRLSCIISEVCFAQNSSSAISLLIDPAKTFSTAYNARASTSTYK